MGVRWTAEVDQILLLKILETSAVNADVKAISAAWPDSLEKPTPRAISERLVKIRKDSKATNSGHHFSVGGLNGAKESGSGISPKKPAGVRKNVGNISTSKTGNAKGGRKRKGAGNGGRNGRDVSDDEESERFKPTPESDDDDEGGSPSKKTRVKSETVEGGSQLSSYDGMIEEEGDMLAV